MATTHIQHEPRRYTGRTKASLSFRIHGGPDMQGTVLAEGNGLMTEEMYDALKEEAAHFGWSVVSKRAADDLAGALDSYFATLDKGEFADDDQVIVALKRYREATA